MRAGLPIQMQHIAERYRKPFTILGDASVLRTNGALLESV